MAKLLVSIAALAAGVLSTIWTFQAFFGGTMPILGVETEGSVGFGLLWLFVIDPIVIGLMGLVVAFVTAPVAMVEARATGREPWT